VKIFIYLDAGL